MTKTKGLWKGNILILSIVTLSFFIFSYFSASLFMVSGESEAYTTGTDSEGRTTYDFTYNGTTGADGSGQAFVAPASGTYKLQVWGASAGSCVSGGAGWQGSVWRCAHGGYSEGEIELSAGEEIYVFVGAAGRFLNNGNYTPASFNGGGAGGRNHSTNYESYSGGGATDIRLSMSAALTGVPNTDPRIIVAGGAGVGSGTSSATAANAGGYGGGSSGGTGCFRTGDCRTGGAGGTQNSGNAPGQGANGVNYSSSWSARQGAGGGWWGGQISTTPVDYGDASGGGSGYVSSALANAVTIAGNQSFVLPDGTTGTGRVGDGYARITMLESIESNLVEELSMSISAPSSVSFGVLTPIATSQTASATLTPVVTTNAPSYELEIAGSDGLDFSSTDEDCLKHALVAGGLCSATSSDKKIPLSASLNSVTDEITLETEYDLSKVAGIYTNQIIVTASVDSSAAPTITGLAYSGTTLVITGTGFEKTYAVRVNNVDLDQEASPCVIDSGTQISCYMVAGLVSEDEVSVATWGGVASKEFIIEMADSCNLNGDPNFTTPIACYTFESQADIAVDAMGNYSGTNNGAVFADKTATGAEALRFQGGVGSFDGVNTKIDLPNITPISGSAARTFVFWARTNTGSAGTFFSQGTSFQNGCANTGRILGFAIDPTLQFTIGSNMHAGNFGQNSLIDGWNFIVVRYTASTGVLNAGVTINGTDRSFTWTVNSGCSLSYNLNTDNIRYYLGVSTDQYFANMSYLNSSMSSFRIYDSALSASEIQAIYERERAQ